MQFFRKYKKYMALLLGIALLGELFVFLPLGFEKAKPIYAETDTDRKTAADISNMSGIPIEEILKLRSTAHSWNEVLDRVKQSGDKIQTSDRGARDKTLSAMDLGDDFIKQLTAEGFSEQDIMDVKMLADRLQYGIRELTDSPTKATQIEKPAAVINPVQAKNARQAVYQKIAQGLDLKDAVRFTLKLRQDFGSFEGALNEYLLSLQLELSLDTYFTNKQQYLKQKEEKRLTQTSDQLVTVSIVEQDLLEKIKTDNSTNKQDNVKMSGLESKDTEKAIKPPLPDVPMPSVKDVRPKNPAEEIQRELHQLNPNKP